VSDDDLDIEEILPADEDDDTVESGDDVDSLDEESAVTGDSEAVETTDKPKAAPSGPAGM
jgi:hypothetical protein